MMKNRKIHTMSTKCQYNDTQVMNECRCGVNFPAAAISVVTPRNTTPMVTCRPWNPVRVKKLDG